MEEKISSQPTNAPPKRNRTKALSWLLLPSASIVFILYLYSKLMWSGDIERDLNPTLLVSILGMILALSGIIAGLAIPVGLVMAIKYFKKHNS